MQRRLAAAAPQREAARAFLTWLYCERPKKRPDLAPIHLCERNPIVGYVRTVETIDELLDEFHGIDRAALAGECIAALSPAGDCPCEREVS